MAPRVRNLPAVSAPFGQAVTPSQGFRGPAAGSACERRVRRKYPLLTCLRPAPGASAPGEVGGPGGTAGTSAGRSGAKTAQGQPAGGIRSSQSRVRNQKSARSFRKPSRQRRRIQLLSTLRVSGSPRRTANASDPSL